MAFTKIREVWMKNSEREIFNIYVTLKTFPYVAMDTEFPGFLENTPRQASFEKRYADLKTNVDSLEPIQLGLALFDASGKIGGAWQVNFCNFNPNTDLQVTASIELLEKNGIDLGMNKRDGVDSYTFIERFMEIANNHGEVRFITFHGLYDMGYFLKLATRSPLPSSVAKFQTKLGDVFGGRVYDIKFMARFFSGMLGGELGLGRLAKILEVERIGECHQAGSDSLLTACVFIKMKQTYKFDDRFYEGLMYGMNGKIQRRRSPPALVLLPRHQFYHHPPVVQCQFNPQYPRVQMPRHSMAYVAPQFYARL